MVGVVRGIFLRELEVVGMKTFLLLDSFGNRRLPAAGEGEGFSPNRHGRPKQETAPTKLAQHTSLDGTKTKESYAFSCAKSGGASRANYCSGANAEAISFFKVPRASGEGPVRRW